MAFEKKKGSQKNAAMCILKCFRKYKAELEMKRLVRRLYRPRLSIETTILLDKNESSSADLKNNDDEVPSLPPITPRSVNSVEYKKSELYLPLEKLV